MANGKHFGAKRPINYRKLSSQIAQLTVQKTATLGIKAHSPTHGKTKTASTMPAHFGNGEKCDG